MHFLYAEVKNRHITGAVHQLLSFQDILPFVQTGKKTTWLIGCALAVDEPWLVEFFYDQVCF